MVERELGHTNSGNIDIGFGALSILMAGAGAKGLAKGNAKANLLVESAKTVEAEPMPLKKLGDGGVQERISSGKLLTEKSSVKSETGFVGDENGGLSGGRGNANTVGKRNFYGDDKGNIFEGKTETNFKGENVVMPKNQIIDSPDLPNSATPEFFEGPFTEAEMLNFKTGNSAGTKLSPHHRHQLPSKFGGVIDEIPGPGHPQGNQHTSGVPRHHNPSIFRNMKGGENLRGKEIRDFWKAKGDRLRKVGDDEYIDPGF